MQSSATDRYLETEVLTAAPQKLQLMLIDAAIRSAERAGRHMQAEEFDQACDALIHAQQVVTELLGGLNRDANSPLARKVAAVYLFVFRSLIDAGVHRDPKKLDDVLKVLRIERETWRRVCQEAGSTGSPEPREDAPSPHDRPGTHQAPTAPGVSGGPDAAGELSSGFSLEA